MASLSRVNLQFLSAIIALFLVLALTGCGDIEGEVSSVTVSPTSATVGISQGYSFSAVGKNSAGTIVTVSPTWSVAGGIGTISSNGFFTAVGTIGSGSVVATVSPASGGSLTGSATVTLTDKGWLTGTIRDSNGGVDQYITVYLVEKPALQALSDTSGKYTISNIPAGTYSAAINANSGIQSSAASHEVTISQGATVTWNPVLIVPTTVNTSTTLPF